MVHAPARSAASRLLALAAAAGLILTLALAAPVFAYDAAAGPAVTPKVSAEAGNKCPAGFAGNTVVFTGGFDNDSDAGGVDIVSVDQTGTGSLQFLIDAPWVAAHVVMKGGSDNNWYDYTGFAAGGVAHDDALSWPNENGNGNAIFCLVVARAPTGSIASTAMSQPAVSSPMATIAFGLILLASLGTLAYANVRSVRNRS